jgi:hypothetical protein
MHLEALQATFAMQVMVWGVVQRPPMRYKRSWRKCYLLVNKVEASPYSSAFSQLIFGQTLFSRSSQKR